MIRLALGKAQKRKSQIYPPPHTNMGHSDISVTMNTYTHLGLDDACEELHRMGEIERARAEQERVDGEDNGEAGMMAI